jgi:general stress protein 26
MQAQDMNGRLLEQLERFETAMLCTRQSNGTMRARPMRIARMQHNGDLWFVTGLGSGKVEEVLHDPGVVATFQSKTRFVSLSGRAEIVGDEELLESLWRDAWREWFPEGRADPRLALIHVRATEAEFWDESAKKSVRHIFEAAKAALAGSRVQPNEEHAHLML